MVPFQLKKEFDNIGVSMIQTVSNTLLKEHMQAVCTNRFMIAIPDRQFWLCTLQ